MRKDSTTAKLPDFEIQRNKVLNREVFYNLKEAKVVIEKWRQEYNTIRPHSSLDYRPPAPEAIMPLHFLILFGYRLLRKILHKF